MKNTLGILSLILISSCGIKSGGGSVDFSVPLNPTKCQGLPREATVDPSTQNCVTNSGLWTLYQLAVENKRITGEKYCNQGGQGNPPRNQNEFNADFSSPSEVSDNDFYGDGLTCASGSTYLNTNGGSYFRVFLWSKAP
jgi:hypothetical protein